MGPIKLKCNSCGGTWPNPQTTGLIYAHACPDQIVDTPEVTHPQTHEIITPAKYKAVENPRNENLKPHPDKPFEFVMVSEGNGVTEV